MSNASPSIHEKIRHKAKFEEYCAARRLGYNPLQATALANEVAAFVDQMVGHTPEGLAA